MAKYIYTCFECGFPFAFEEEDVPDKCPACTAPKSQFLKEPWAGSIETRRIHVDPPAPDENHDPYDISFHIAKNFMNQKGDGRIRRWVMAYDDAEISRKFYEDTYEWDIVNTEHSDPENPVMYCATGPGTADWQPRVPSFSYGYLVKKREGYPDSAFIVEVKSVEKTKAKVIEFGGKVLKDNLVFEGERYCLINDSEGNPFYLWEIPEDAPEPKCGINPGRPPKKFTKKSLHGRTRVAINSYKDLRRYQTFIINVFGWDMMELPEATSCRAPGDPHPGLLVATGPSQTDYEGATPNHMNMMVIYSELEDLEKPGSFFEVTMDDPLDDTIQKMVDNGGKLITDRNKTFFAKEPDDSKQSWEVSAVVEDPAGNYMYLWKCPSSRTWEELETDYDKE